MIKKIPKISVYAALFLIPLFSLPFTMDALDFQKQFLLFIITSIGILFWAWNAVSDKKLEVNLNPLNLFVAGLAAVVFVSSIFSLYRYGSLWGTPLPIAESFVTLLSLIFLYLLIINNFRKKDLYKPVVVLAVSGTIALMYGVIQSFGQKWGFYLLPFLSYTKNSTFNTIGTANSLLLFGAIILAAVFPLAFIIKNKFSRLLSVLSGLIFSALIFFNGIVTLYFPSKVGSISYELSLAPWIVLLVSVLAVFVFSISDQKFLHNNVNAKNASFIVLLVTLVFLVFNTFAKPMVSQMYDNIGTKLGIQAIPEASLHQQASIDVAINVLKQSAQTFLLGSGPGTFNYDYMKFKPEKINQDNLGWNLVFLNGTSEFINRIATTGLLGVIALLLIVVFWTIEGFRMLTREDGEVGLSLAVFAGWLAVVAALFYYPFNLSLMLLFWFFLAAIVVLDEERLIAVPLKTVKMNYAVSLAFVALLGLELWLLVYNSKHYYAEVEYLGALKAYQQKDIATAIKKLEVAADATDRLQDTYLTGLSQIYMAQAEAQVGKQDGQKPEAALQAAAPYIRTAVKSAMQSTDTANPNNPNNWAARAYLYGQLTGVVDGYDNEALNMYQKALSLEPKDPTLWNEVGQIYIVKKDLDKARESFSKAIFLRPQYVDPHLSLALIYDQQQDKENAIRELEIVAQLVTDKTALENVTKAIQNLREGKSLSGATSDSQISTSEQIPVTEGQQGSLPSATSTDIIAAEPGSTTLPIKP